ncbi:hypothetical protein PTKIN_Ptkin13bG0240800 [Pterospermum kingtungense]
METKLDWRNFCENLIGRCPTTLSQELKACWNNLFLVNFPSLEDKDRVLDGGPWHFQNLPMFVRKWEPKIETLEFAMDSLSMWVRLGNIPLELFHQKGIGCIASAIEIGVSVTVPIEIEVVLRSGKIVKVKVNISWIPAKCLDCRIFGHVEKQCPKKAVEATTIDDKDEVKNKDGNDEDFDEFEGLDPLARRKCLVSVSLLCPKRMSAIGVVDVVLDVKGRNKKCKRQAKKASTSKS